MQPLIFPFRMPGVLYAGVGALQKLGPEAKRLGARRAAVMTDPILAKIGVADRAKDLLVAEGVEVEIYPEVEPEPSFESLDAAHRFARAGNFDLYVGFGGGSSIDVAKTVAMLMNNSGSPRDYVGVDKIPNPARPSILIPTTAGTGAEITPNAIFGDITQGLKLGLVSPYLIGTVAIVDPEVTLTCPPRVTAAAGMDALTHAIESYTARKATPATDIWAIEAVRLITRSIRTAYCAGFDLTARTDLALGSLFAGVSLANAGVAAVHAMAYPLGGQFHIPHGEANSMLLPYVLEFNVLASLGKFVEIARAMGEPIEGLPVREAAIQAVDSVKQLSLDVGIPVHLREKGVPQDAIPGMAKGAIAATRLVDNNPRTFTYDDAVRIFEAAW